MTRKAKVDNKSELGFPHEDQLFLSSAEGRNIRVLSEFMSPAHRFEKYGINNTIAFFGSARTLGTRDCKKQLKEAREWAAYEKEREDNYVGYEDAIKSTHAYQSILKKK